MLGAAGGVGTAAVELGKLLGGRVIAAASTDEKVAFCKRARRRRGRSSTAARTSRSATKALTNGAGADVIYDPVGGALSEARAALDRLGRAISRRGLRRRRHPEDPAEPRALEGLPDRRRVLGPFAMREPARNRANSVKLFDWVAEGAPTARSTGRVPVRPGRRGARADGEAPSQRQAGPRALIRLGCGGMRLGPWRGGLVDSSAKRVSGRA